MNKMSIHHKKRVYLLFLCSLFGILSVYLIDAGRLFGFDFVEGVETVAEMDNLPQTLKDYEGYLKHKFGDYMELPPESERKVHPISKLKLEEDEIG